MDPLLCCPPEKLIEFRRNQGSIRCRRMKTFFTHTGILNSMIANLLRTPGFHLDENMVYMHLENLCTLPAPYTDVIEILFLNLAHHPSVLAWLFSKNLHAELSMYFEPNGLPTRGICPWLIKTGMCTCWMEGVHDRPDDFIPIWNIKEEKTGEIVHVSLNR